MNTSGMTAVEQCRYFTGRLVRVYGRLNYGTGNDRWTGVLQGVVRNLRGAEIVVLLEDGREEPTQLPVIAVREVRPAGR